MSDPTCLPPKSTPNPKKFVEFMRCILADFLHIYPEERDVNINFQS